MAVYGLDSCFNWFPYRAAEERLLSSVSFVCYFSSIQRRVVTISCFIFAITNSQPFTPFSKLLKIKMFATNFFPLLLLSIGVTRVWGLRHNNYGCGEDVPAPTNKPDDDVWFVLFCILLITYALELLVFPAMFANSIIRLLRKHKLFDRKRVEGRGGKASRFEFKLGMTLKLLQCVTCSRAGGSDLKNKGELKEFCSHGELHIVSILSIVEWFISSPFLIFVSSVVVCNN